MSLPQWHEKPEALENVDNWQWLVEHCWMLRLDWHRSEGYEVRCTFDSPSHPIGSTVVCREHQNRKTVLAEARQAVEEAMSG